MYVGLGHLGQGNNKLEGRGNVDEFTSTKNIFLKRDVPYGKLRPLLNKVWLVTESRYCTRDILPLVTNEKLLNHMLLRILSNYNFFWYAVGKSAGTKMPRTNWSDIRKFIVGVPPIKEQEKISSILNEIDNKIKHMESKKIYLENLKKGIMPKLIIGQIRVKV